MKVEQDLTAVEIVWRPKSVAYLSVNGDDNAAAEREWRHQRHMIDAYVRDTAEIEPPTSKYIDVFLNSDGGRPGLEQLIRDAQAGRFKYVIIEHPERLGYDTMDALLAYAKLYETGVQVMFAEISSGDGMWTPNSCSKT